MPCLSSSIDPSARPVSDVPARTALTARSPDEHDETLARRSLTYLRSGHSTSANVSRSGCGCGGQLMGRE